MDFLRTIRFWVWAVPLALYGLFWLWYTPLSGPLTSQEVETIVESVTQRGDDPESIERLRAFFEADDGHAFVMVNITDLAEAPRSLPATGPDASARDLMGHYLEYMFPALLRRACHPLFAGPSIHTSMDVVGIEGADYWQSAALMRYRSRRDLWEIISHPSFTDRHDYKIAALDKTIAFPVAPILLLSDPRLLFALGLLAILGLVDLIVWRRRQRG